MATHRLEGRSATARGTREDPVREGRRWPREEDVPDVREPVEPAAPAAPPAARTSAGLRADVTTWGALQVLAGIWLILSPWIVGYTGADASWNPIVCGALLVVLAGARMLGAYRATALSLLNAAIGVWLFVSGFWLADSTGARWNVWILGVIVFVLALAGTSASGALRARR